MDTGYLYLGVGPRDHILTGRWRKSGPNRVGASDDTTTQQFTLVVDVS